MRRTILLWAGLMTIFACGTSDDSSGAAGGAGNSGAGGSAGSSAGGAITATYPDGAFPAAAGGPILDGTYFVVSTATKQ